MAQLGRHQHGKGKVRVGRVWRDGDTHTFKEWSVDTNLVSDMAHAFLDGSNEGMTATDAQKNTVYYIAKKLPMDAAPEDFALALARHFVDTYKPISKAQVWVQEMPWVRAEAGGQAHDHAYARQGCGTRTAYADCDEGGAVTVHGGITDWQLLKTTQSGYEGYEQDEYTKLEPTKDRMLASSVTAEWHYTGEQPEYKTAFEKGKAALAEALFGPAKGGVYSPSVQYTLYRMGEAALAKVDCIDVVRLNMPNIHYLPLTPVNSEPFDHDVFIATSEPHGTIEATVEREGGAAVKL